MADKFVAEYFKPDTQGGQLSEEIQLLQQALAVINTVSTNDSINVALRNKLGSLKIWMGNDVQLVFPFDSRQSPCCR
jgi:hypothetical protein